jgi:hypothetical protein
MRRERNTLSHQQSPMILPDDLAILVLTFGSRWSILLVPASQIDAAQPGNLSANRRRQFCASLVVAQESGRAHGARRWTVTTDWNRR